MKNSILRNIGLLLLLVLFTNSCTTSCHEQKKPKIGKTLLIYFAANNNLSSYAEGNIYNILNNGYAPDYFEAGGSGDVLLAYTHIRNQKPRLYRFSKDETGTINREIIIEWENHNSVSDSVMNSVLNYTLELFPGEENGLVLWSHGYGWLPEGYYHGRNTSKSSSEDEIQIVNTQDAGVSYDHLVKSFGNSGEDELDTKKFSDAIKNHYSYILYDACYMGTVEVAYQMKDRADYQIMSPAEILADGFPYDVMTKTLLGSSLPLEDRLISVCDGFYNHYANQSSKTMRSATVSLIKSSQLSGLAEATKKILTRDIDSIQNLTMSDIQGYFRYNKHYFYDLDDFISRISSNPTEYSDFERQLSMTVIHKRATPYFLRGDQWGFKIDHYSGLSTYIPKPHDETLDSYYLDLPWNKAVGMIK